jgi:hypothetical protein
MIAGEVQEPVPVEAMMTKAEWREQQRNLSFTEKFAVLEKLRERSIAIGLCGLRKRTPE